MSKKALKAWINDPKNSKKVIKAITKTIDRESQNSQGLEYKLVNEHISAIVGDKSEWMTALEITERLISLRGIHVLNSIALGRAIKATGAANRMYNGIRQYHVEFSLQKKTLKG